MSQLFVLAHDVARQRAIQAVQDAPVGMVITIKEANRTSDQNAKFHALCSDLAKSKAEWAGKPRNAAQWKVLLVSGHAIATGEGAEVVPGLEGEFINLRESTALMSIKRGSSLIEYSQAWCALHGIETEERRAA